MANEFLAQPVMPGTQIPQAEHRRMSILLSLAVIILIILGIMFWLNMKAAPAPITLEHVTTADERAHNEVLEQISNNPPATVSSEEQAAIGSQLTNKQSSASNEATTKQEVLDQL